jgi:PAS domain S-box-containing protein
VVRAAAVYAIAGGLVTLLGWAIDAPRLTDWRNDGISMFPNTAACAVLTGVALLLLHRPPRRWRTGVAVVAGVVSAAGLLTLLENVLRIDFGIDRLIFDDPRWGQTAAAAPMRMGPPASVSFAALGGALILAMRGPRARTAAAMLGSLTMSIAMLSLTGYLYGAEQMFTIPRLTGIALPTASILFVLGMGVLASVPDREPMRTLMEPSAAGLLARRTMPWLVLLALALGWMRVTLQTRGFVDTAFGTALRTVVELALLLWLLWWSVAKVRAHERARHRSEAQAQRADETRALLAAIVDTSEDVIVSKTLDGIITSWNAAAERLFGYASEEAIGRSIDLILPPDRRDEEREILGRLRRGERIEQFETVRRRKDGRLIDVSLTISPVKDATGRVIGASKIARDVTERKREEAQRAEQARRKDEFIAILAHELRNPLSPIRSSARYLKLRRGADAELQRPVDVIERQVGQMSRLIDDLLDVSRVTHGTLELRRERVTCAEIVEFAVDACRDDLEARGHTLHTRLPREPVTLDADRERLAQVLCNLMSNAAKYTPDGGRIDLVVTVPDDGVLEISVKDTGIGIPQAKLSEIFDLFARVDPSPTSQGGLGIGLTLVRQLVELHGGTVEARSAGPDQGSEFVLRLPVITTSAPAVERGQPPPATIPLRVLIADDNLDAAESLTLLLQLKGHDAHAVFDGEAAIDSAERLRPQVALLDIGMPKADGYEVARRMRACSWGKAIYLVALTGWGQESDKAQARQAGFDAHLVKPVMPETLDELLAAVGSATA